MDVFEAINKGDWQKVKDNVVPGKVRRNEERRSALPFLVEALRV